MRRTRSVRDRLMDKIKITPTGCWEWQGARNADGYGRISVGGRGGRQVATHRLSWELDNGPIPIGMCVLHACDTPPCCNPDHLTLGTLSENTRDMLSKGRNVAPRGLRSPRAKLTDEQVREIRRRVGDGERLVDIAPDYPVSGAHLSKVARGLRWPL